MEDYGPLTKLIGTWTGSRGMDVAPESDGVEQNPYYETITFEACGSLTNAEQQQLTMLRYLQVVKRKSNDEVFHDQTGYWMWDPATETVMLSVAIPRGVTLLAGGKAEQRDDGTTILRVSSSLDEPHWTIAQSPFMAEKASTVGFDMEVTLSDSELSYSQNTLLDIYGKKFDHTDDNTLQKA